MSDKASLAVANAIGKVRSYSRFTLKTVLTAMDLQDNITVIRSPVTDLKAIKNDVEVEGLFPFFTVIIYPPN